MQDPSQRCDCLMVVHSLFDSGLSVRRLSNLAYDTHAVQLQTEESAKEALDVLGCGLTMLLFTVRRNCSQLPR